MQVNNLAAVGTDRVRVSIGEVQNPGGGPGVGMGASGQFGYECEKGDEPKLWDVVTVTITTTAA